MLCELEIILDICKYRLLINFEWNLISLQALVTKYVSVHRIDNGSNKKYNLFQAQLDEQLAGLQTLTAARRSKLEESIKLHQYLQEVEEVLSWLADKEATASSDNYGKEFEHLLVRRHNVWIGKGSFKCSVIKLILSSMSTVYQLSYQLWYECRFSLSYEIARLDIMHDPLKCQNIPKWDKLVVHCF